MKMLHQKKSVLQIFRLLVQIAFFIFLPSLYYSTFQGIKQFYQSIMQGTFDLTALLPQMIEAIAIIPLTILLGRFFCGWMCAFGALSDFIYRITGEFVKVKLSERSDRILKSLKYVWLLVLIVVFWSFDITVLNALSPWNVFGMLATFGKTPDFSYVAANLFGGLLFLILILGASAVVERFFCRYLCPLGALLSLGSLLRIAKIRKPAEHCGNCRICTNQCAMGIPLYQKNIVKTGECINCMKCVTACPRHNVSLAVAGEDIRPVLASTMAVAAMTGMYYTVNLAERMTGVTTATAAVTSSSSAGTSSQDTSSDSSQSSSQQTVTSGDAKDSSAAAASSASSVSSKYKDGTYQGSGTGFRGATTAVSVTVQSGAITQVNVLSYGDDEPFFSRASEGVIQSIVKNQSAEVDAVSGATYSSNGIMQAVANALAKAE